MGLQPSQLYTINVSALANKEGVFGLTYKSLIIEKKGSLKGDLMEVSKKYTAMSLLIMIISLIFLRLVMTLV